MKKILLFAVMLISGCVYPVNYESTPVSVSTSQGIVSCQLYTTQLIFWDRAIAVPAGMSIKTGDAICKKEGIRRKEIF